MEVNGYPLGRANRASYGPDSLLLADVAGADKPLIVFRRATLMLVAGITTGIGYMFHVVELWTAEASNLPACDWKGIAMPSLDEIIDENMVCATVNASHNAMSSTIQAYLMAHQPDRRLAFDISIPSTDAEDWCEQMLDNAGVSFRRSSKGHIIGTAAGRIWTKVLVENGELFEIHSIALCPVRPGGVEA